MIVDFSKARPGAIIIHREWNISVSFRKWVEGSLHFVGRDKDGRKIKVAILTPDGRNCWEYL